jgi:CHAP domain
MASGLDIVNIAAKQIGFIEGPNNQNPYGSWYGVPNQPYCAMFVSWVFEQAGASSLVAAETPKGFSYCPAGLRWFQTKGAVVDKYKGFPGDLVFYCWDNTGTAQHVGILEAASPDGLTVIEANTSPDHFNGSQSDGGGVYRRHRPYLNVMAIVRPAYAVTHQATTSRTTKNVAGGTAALTALGGGTAAVVHNTSTPTPKPTTTVLVAPPFPGSSAFKVGAKGNAELIVARALANAGLLPANLVSNVLTAEEIALIPVYQSKIPGLLQEMKLKELGPETYISMTAKAGS